MTAAANVEKAAGMQAYMKSTMPYYGINMPEVRAISRRVFDGASLTCDGWRETVLDLWHGARRREAYAALYVLGMKQHRGCLGPDAMPMLEEMVVTGAWWDLVDELAHVVGDILRANPRPMKPLLRRWSRDPNLWKRRVSIICQLGFRRETDLDLLYANIEPNLAERDFFIRKAIGWALRQYAWTDPDEVRRYVAAHESQLSGLSRREALKNLLPRPARKATRRASARSDGE